MILQSWDLSRHFVLHISGVSHQIGTVKPTASAVARVKQRYTFALHLADTSAGISWRWFRQLFTLIQGMFQNPL